MSADLQSQKIMEEKNSTPVDETTLDLPPLDQLQKGRWERTWPTIACGAGLFSDGYLNGVCVLHYFLVARLVAYCLPQNCAPSHIDPVISRISD